MSRDELQWQPLYARCGECKTIGALVVDTAYHPHLNGRVGVRCPHCRRGSIYEFQATPEGEIASQAAARQQRDVERGEEPAPIDPEEWLLFQAAMFGLMPQPAEAEDYAPDQNTLFYWRLLRAESVGLRDRVEEDHAD